MAVRQPLVMGDDNRPQRLQPGDSLSNVTATNTITRTATPALIKGNVVYTSGSGAVSKAVATGVSTSKVLGLAMSAVSAGTSVVILMNEVMTMTTAEWDAVAGTTGGLVAGTTYYLSATAGLMTSTPLTTQGQTAVIIGEALSSTEMNVEPTQPILL